jgi:hypothetical protein
MARLAILKHTYDLSGEMVCEQWIENPYYQYFCGEECQSASNFDPSERRVLTVALASSELAGVAETWRARAA